MTAPKLSRETDNGRVYTHPQRQNVEVPSVTNVTKMLDKSKFLTPWAKRKCGEAARDNFDVIKSMHETDPDGIVDYIRTAPDRSSDGSSVIGDVVHLWIGDFIDAGGRTSGFVPDTDPDAYEGNLRVQKVLRDKAKTQTARHMWIQFLGWDKAMGQSLKWEWLLAETTVWSEKHAYAGTLDWMARATPKSGAPYVILGDTKTGNRTYAEVGMQLAALFYADYAFDKNGEQFQLPVAESFGVLHVRPRFARLQPVEHIDKCMEAFLGCRALFDWRSDVEDEVLKMGQKVESTVAGVSIAA